MLKKENRFKGNKAINAVIRKGGSAYEQNIKLKYILNPNQKDSKFAVVVSKKISKSAVVRNRIRRRLYASLKPHLNNKGLFVLFVYSDNFKSIKFAVIKSSISSLFEEST